MLAARAVDDARRFLRSLRSFHRRRIDIAVGPDDLVLDVGSGDKPHWRADVLVDQFPHDTHGGQRSGSAAARVDRPLFCADAAALPFADGAFAYVNCSHLLEHVVDPAAVVAELTRVAGAGYIEVPAAPGAKIVDFPSHLWWCRYDGMTLSFTAKQSPAFDPEIDQYLRDADLARRVDAVLDSEFDHRVVAVEWRDAVAVTVDGVPHPDVVAAAAAADVAHHDGTTALVRLLTAAMTLPLRYGPRRIARHDTIRFDDVVAAPYRRGTDEVLEPRVYRLDEVSSA